LEIGGGITFNAELGLTGGHPEQSRREKFLRKTNRERKSC